jgi:LPXTG-motif cell wall-anchored protein
MNAPLKRRRVAVGTMVLGAALATIGLLAPTASADHVNPTPVTGDNNMKCDEVPNEDYIGEHKINEQPDNDTTYSFDLDPGTPGNEVEIFISGLTTVAGEMQFDWSATTVDGDDDGDARDPFFYDAVIVKAGGGGTESSGNLYTYNPEVSTDTDLVSPKDSISHISFCFDGVGTTTTTEEEEEETTTTEESEVSPTTVTKKTEVKGNVVLPNQLPRTGANDGTLTIVGVALVLIGAGALRVRRNVAPRHMS